MISVIHSDLTQTVSVSEAGEHPKAAHYQNEDKKIRKFDTTLPNCVQIPR